MTVHSLHIDPSRTSEASGDGSYERSGDEDQCNPESRQDLMVISKVLKYSSMGHVITLTEKLFHGRDTRQIKQ